MNLQYVPLLKLQRELHDIPRGMTRFQTYLRTIGIGNGTTTLELPSLAAMNPMGKEHVAALLDALLEMDADRIAAETATETAQPFEDEPGELKLALVVADDLMGGWTNRFASEFALRFPARVSAGEPRLPRWLMEHWLTAILWSSEPASERAVREAVRTTVHRAVRLRRCGSAVTLRDMLDQEGEVMSHAGCVGPTLDDDDLDFTREVIAPHLDATDMRTAIECLFGDAAGRTLGFSPRGLSPWAGLALALHDARSASVGR